MPTWLCKAKYAEAVPGSFGSRNISGMAINGAAGGGCLPLSCVTVVADVPQVRCQKLLWSSDTLGDVWACTAVYGCGSGQGHSSLHWLLLKLLPYKLL